MDRREAITGLGTLLGGAMIGARIDGLDLIQTGNNIDDKIASKRKKVVLTDNWKFQADIKNIGEEEKWFSDDFSASRRDWANVVVPRAWDCFEAALWEYEGIGWYSLDINPNDFVDGKRTDILFNRVMYYSKLWINGEFIGENIGGYLPFNFNITSHLKAGKSNRLVLRADNKPRLEWLPSANQIEWIQYGGILDKVVLTGTSFTFIEDLIIRTNPDNSGAQVNCIANIVNESDASSSMQLNIAITRGSVAINKTVEVLVKPHENAQVNIDFVMERADLWSPDTPSLYLATASLKKEGAIIDDLSERFGIRKVSAEGTSILLNGKPLIIKGVNRYDDYGRLGTTVPEKLLREELALMKSVGINMIRVHYPQSPDLLSLYDEYGFVMMEEVPMCWWGRKMEQTMDILKYAKPALTKMIKRDKNHPCLIIWSMSNESVTDSEVGIAVMRDLLVQGKALDPTRLVTYVIDGNDDPVKHLALDKADVIVINKYYGVLHEKICRHISDIEEYGYKRFFEKMTEHRKSLPDKPMFLGEYGAQGIKGMHGDLYYSEEFQSAYISRIWDAIKEVEGLSGGILWCWADYFHRKYFISYAAFGPYGVVTTDRKPKKSLETLTKMYGGSKPRKS